MTMSRPAGSRDPALFERLAVLHRPDCSALAAQQPEAPLPDEAEVARLLNSDAAGRYAIEARAVFEDLRRLIGQLAGLLILARLTTARDHADLPEMRACRERQTAINNRLASLNAPAPLTGHRERLGQSAAFCARIMTGLLAWRPDGPGAEADFAALNAKIRKAYALLESCGSDRAGLQMIDFSHACCACGGH